MADYSHIVQQAQWRDDVLHAVIAEDWGQGRTIFGGLSAGLAVHAMLPQVVAGRPLRSALTSFVGPVRAGEVAIHPRLLRSGRNVTHVRADVIQDDAVCCTVLACFGMDRDTPVHVEPSPMQPLPAPEELPSPPFVPGISPEFTRYVDYRWTHESMPYLGNGDGSSDGWIRLREASAVTPDRFMLLADAWPSPALAMLQGPAPVSSLTWSLEIFDLGSHHRTDAWWRIHACIDAASSGYVHEDALIWAPDGSPAARSRQTVSVYLPLRDA